MTASLTTRPDLPCVVLVGVDFSELSIEALDLGQNMVAESQGELHVVHVLPLQPSDGPVPTVATRELRYAELTAEVQGKLEGLVDGVPAAVRRIALHVRVGRADIEIAQLASDVGGDLIIVGTHGLPGLARLVLGSVSEGLVRHATCAVLSYRPKSAPLWTEIEPPCPECTTVQRQTSRQTLWCARHSQSYAYAEVAKAPSRAALWPNPGG
jgi:nucleotide-binding universal stress UspA family protein